MKQPDLFTPPPSGRQLMNGKPVFTVPAKTIINFESNFGHKLLCDELTFSTGSACVYSCCFCYVPDLMRKLRAIPAYSQVKGDHDRIVIRRERALEVLRSQLTDRHGQPKFKVLPDGQPDRRVIYSSPLVDVAANLELVRETIEVCKLILDLTNWQIRLLSKSNLLPKVAEGLYSSWACNTVGGVPQLKRRMIFGFSTGTLDDGLAKAFEAGTPLVSKRLAALHWLQDHGYRTFGMVCPSLPQLDYDRFAQEMAAAIRADRCEHVWAEVINLRGESFSRTVKALGDGGFYGEQHLVEAVMENKQYWEDYARDTFEAHAGVLPKGKLRFLQYVTPATRSWWEGQTKRGAVVL